MRLALVCGQADVDKFLASIPSKQLSEWIAYEKLEGPIDLGPRLDLASASIQNVIANFMQFGKRRKKYRIKDFLPKWGAEVEQTPEKMLDKFKQAFGWKG